MNSKKWVELALPTEDSPVRQRFPHEVGGIAADDYRMHMHGNAQFVEGSQTSEEIFKSIERCLATEPKFLFKISKKFLLDALKGMGDDVMFFNAGENQPVFITESAGAHRAIIMPMIVWQDERDRILTLPKRPEPIPPIEGGYG